MNNKLTNIIFTIAIIVLTSCTEELFKPVHSNGKEGESVKVRLNFRIPPTSRPLQLQSRKVAANKDFSVEFFDENKAGSTRSSGTVELYNLWLFQFNSDGSIHGSPQKVSDQVNMVNDMALLDVSLRVGTEQTIYMVVLGRKVTTKNQLEEVSNIKDLENIQLDYLDNRNGLYYSRITDENDIPYAGAAQGVSVRKLNDTNDGEIVYGTPDGFSGGIEIKRLVSRITLKHQFELTDNILEGMRLLKVPTQLFINPSSVGQDVINSISMVDLESDNKFSDTDKDADGFFTSEWYVAQNKQGTISGIIAEKDRYRKVDDGSGKAPELGTNIEAWSYAKNNRSLYTVHQIYVGKNNTDNFDIEINNYYNLRTIINSGDLSDGRIRSYTAVQKVYLSSNGSRQTGTGTVTGDRSTYFDAHYGWRPVIIYAQGRKVTVGIYRDASCNQLVNMDDSSENWLQLSSYPNYTEVVRNGGTSALTNQFETNIFVPTRFKLYLYADEYIVNTDGSITNYNLDKNTIYKAAANSNPTTFLNERVLYIKVTTEEITAEGTPKKLEGIYTIKQKQGYYTGLFGGDIVDGQYTKGLIIDGFNEHTSRIDDQYPNPSEYVGGKYIYFGYYGNFTNYSWSESNNIQQNYHSFTNGKQATYNFATNPSNYPVNTGKESQIPAMRKINGKIDLYQYNYFNSYHARFCHDLNRDKNGNGVIDYFPDDPERNELEWYLPSIYQALGILTSAGTIYYGFGPLALASEMNANNCPGWESTSSGWSSSNGGKNDWKYVRCVRDIPVPNDRKNGTKVTTYTENGDSYVMVNLTNLPYGITDRSTTEGKADLYEELDLYSYSTKGELYDESNPQANASKPLGKKVRRAIKNIPQSGTISHNISVSAFSSPKFIVSPTDVFNDGDTKSNNVSEILKDAYDNPKANSITMTWAEANGRLNTANTQGWNIESQAMNTGCYAYRGKSGKDEPGSWRVPNHRELSIILIFAHDLENYSIETGFEKLAMAATATSYSPGYWSSTQSTTLNGAVLGGIDKNYALTLYDRGTMNSTGSTRLRCIKDIP